jgi:hypothetical protein
MSGRLCIWARAVSTAMVVATLLAAVPLAFAGDANKGTDPAKAAALAHFETAGRLFDVREYGKALEEYKVAYLAKPDIFVQYRPVLPQAWTERSSARLLHPVFEEVAS